MKNTNSEASLGNFALLCLGGYFFAIAYGVTFLIPLMVEQRGGSEAFAGAVISTATISTVLLVIISGHIADTFGSAKAVATSGIFLVAAMFGFFISSNLSHNLMLFALLLGIGWGVFYTLAPILVSAIIKPERRIRFFALLSGSMMAGIGTGPLVGRMVTSIHLPIEYAFLIAGLASLSGVAICFYLDHNFTKNNNVIPHVSKISPKSIFAIAHSNAIFPIVMVGLGACIFGGLSSFQTTYAQTFGFDYSLFFAGFMLAAIGCRLMLAGYVVKRNPFISSFLLTSLVAISIFMFIKNTNQVYTQVYTYVLASIILGVGYGLNYSVINGLAANEAPAGLMPQSLLLFSLSYFVGLFGFPIIAGAIIVQAGIISMLYILLTIAIVITILSIFRIWQQRHSIFRATRLR